MTRLRLVLCFSLLGLFISRVPCIAQDSLPDGRKPFPMVSGDKVLMLGDSITQDGRYVDLITGYIWAVYPDRDIQIFNAGLSSETVSGITEPVHPFPRPNVLDRIHTALTIVDPDWVIVCYGMNDGIYHPIEERITAAYEEGMQKVVSAIHESGAKAILLSPPVFDAQAPAVVKRLSEVSDEEPYGYLRPYEKYDETLVSLTNSLERFRQDPRVERVIDLHAEMYSFLLAAKQANPEFAYGDGVHPPLEGHAAMAAAALFGLGEDEEKINQVLARIADVRPPGTDSQTLPATANSEELRRELFERGKAINAMLRKAVDPKTPQDQVPALGNEAMKYAQETLDPLRDQVRAAVQ